MRATNGVARKRKHKRVLKAARGYFGRRSKCYGSAKVSLMRAGRFAYAHRRKRRRDFRKLWIVRINAAARNAGMNYASFMHGLKEAGVELDRRQLSELAIHDLPAFNQLVEVARKASRVTPAAS